ncbi:hypothetical protein [Gimesia panareensis]|uniref:hypothetical protein n=1 Tax=Gimesia panareensis TaxID=2527978 RepID=UPI0011882987|nr:hypothetical protein [Gimesia panareensis]QDU52928.1 hypothetical protein Pan110_53100 [Gimesia panareensis]
MRLIPILILMATNPAYCMSYGDKLEAWPSRNSAADFLAAKVVSDLRYQRNLSKPCCILRGKSDPETKTAIEAVSLAFNRYGFQSEPERSELSKQKMSFPLIDIETTTVGKYKVLILRFMGKQYRAEHLEKAWVDDSERIVNKDGMLHLRVKSKRHPDCKASQDEARQILESELVSILANRTDQPLPAELLKQNIKKLISLNNTQDDRFTEKVEKPYGPMFREHLLVKIRHHDMDQWISELVVQSRIQRHLWMGFVLGTIGFWGLGWPIAIILDRWTCGYSRLTIIYGVLLTLSTSTAGAWSLLLNW